MQCDEQAKSAVLPPASPKLCLGKYVFDCMPLNTLSREHQTPSQQIKYVFESMFLMIAFERILDDYPRNQGSYLWSNYYQTH
mmetsp:Transcript_4513/g.8856  ORF Transcript_4513/g.8856 Transcript_4513/m.8856 type:complete len:82 (+) Transcript_4513:35-280(+)